MKDPSVLKIGQLLSLPWHKRTLDEKDILVSDCMSIFKVIVLGNSPKHTVIVMALCMHEHAAVRNVVGVLAHDPTKLVKSLKWAKKFRAFRVKKRR